MTDTFHCDDKETLIAYLYGEIDADLRRQVDGHLRTCAACASEVEGLQDVRQDLETWLSPEPELGFTIVQQNARVLRPARWSMPVLPAWARVAAAVLVMAGSAAIANVQVKYGQDGLTVRTGWMPIETTPPAPVAQVSGPGFVGEPAPVAAQRLAPAADAEWRQALTSLETEMRRELQAIRQASNAQPSDDRVVRTASSRSIDGDALLRRVQALIAESEKRYQGEMALRFTQFSRDFDIRRRADLQRIDSNLGLLQGRTDRQMLNLYQRVSTQQP